MISCGFPGTISISISITKLHTMLTYIFLILIVTKYVNGNCEDQKTCELCIQEFGCSWCEKMEIGDSSCFIETENKCSDGNIHTPKSDIKIVKDYPLQADTNEKVVQIKPQHIKMKMRKGENQTIKFQYRQASNFPIDLYYLLDFSASMKKNKDALVALGNVLIKEMQVLTKNFRIGLGSFVEKPVLPYVSTVKEMLELPCPDCVSPYIFKNHLSLSSGEEFTKILDAAQLSGNLDVPECGLEALMQVMVCKEGIGWRDNARHLIVYSSDANFHIAGDGKLAGIIKPNDAQCHMEQNELKMVEFDYPSISHTNHVINKNQTIVLFAIDGSDSIINQYKAFRGTNENVFVEPLTNTEGLIDVIVRLYKNITGTVEIVQSTNPNVEITYSSDCKEKINNACTNIKANYTINYEANIKALSCGKETIEIKTKGLNEPLLIDLEVQCDCKCDKTPIAKECNSNGKIRCGLCECNQGYYGETCECTGANENLNMEACTNNTLICSQRGECICGTCICESNEKGKIYGTYCECDTFSCAQTPNGICNDKGTCDCGKCKCNNGWSGEVCECRDDSESCHHNGKVCNSRGSCVCGKCECNEGYFGSKCQDCASCSRCEEFKPCIECALFNESTSLESCSICSGYKYEKVSELDVSSKDVKFCSVEYDEDCNIIFLYKYDNMNNLFVQIQEKLQCSEPINLAALLGGIIGAILFIGLLTLILWKVFTEIHDRREYTRFLNDKAQNRWGASENPLYKQATTTYVNPLHN